MPVLESSLEDTLGMQAPSFSLPNPAGEIFTLESFADAEALLVMFICNHCPFVLHIIEGVADFARENLEQGLATVAISSNDIQTHPEDSPEKMQLLAEQYDFSFPYLYDETQQVAKDYDAVCTPEFLLFDKSRSLYYRGQFDASRPYTEWDIKFGNAKNKAPVDGRDLRCAFDALLAGQSAPQPQVQSVGCNIKWKSESEADDAQSQS